jgi:hypothetical protein
VNILFYILVDTIGHIFTSMSTQAYREGTSNLRVVVGRVVSCDNVT